ncbi:AMP-binding protein [Haloechinothrix halophila]|uniref:AMP-binding protein n=1 Tax=Haloechinothrix halophila TaxID=1069073 RepID=UPI00041887FE
MADTVQQLLLANADRDDVGVRFGDRCWTWREYVAESLARAAVITGGFDSDRPPHVGVLLENTPEMAMALAAGALGGYVTVGLNATRRGEALARDVRKADCQFVLTDSRHLPLLDGLSLDGVRVIDTDAAEWSRLVADAPRDREFRTVDSMDTFMLIFTSGTSGEPKAVRVSNFMVTMSGTHLVERFSLTDDDVCYVSMPLFHSNAVVAGFGPAVASGATLALARRFSATGFLDDVRRYGATYMNYVGKPLAYVLATPEKPDDADNPLRIAFGNEASDRDIVEFGRRFGCEVYDCGSDRPKTPIIISRTEGTPPSSIGQPWVGCGRLRPGDPHRVPAGGVR